MSVEVELRVDGIEEFERKMNNVNIYMQRHIRHQLQNLGSDIHMMARRLCPVRTGGLRDSIYSKIEDWTLKVGATAPYSYWVELGSRYMRGFYFLTEAIQLHLPRLAEIVRQGLEWAVREASTS